ncbi:MAG: hypothetical protein QOK48_258 [Blastocatellia bacterium]|nr:hypothetical protein [Blastocatellia bacterium]
MTSNRPDSSKAARSTTTVVLCLCVCLLTSSLALGQKAPDIFKSGSTSAMNKEYVNGLQTAYTNASTPEEKKLLRNRLIYIGVEQIDTVFNEYRKKSRKRNDLLNFLFDFLEIGVSTTIGIINGERAKSVLAEALTGFKGSRTAANKNFHLMETQIIFNKMVTNRSKTLVIIYKKMNEDTVSYPWERARTDLKNYFFAGTFDDALNSLSIDTGAEASEAVKTIQELTVKTTADVEKAHTCDQNRATVFLAARNADPSVSSTAILKLKAALKNNLDLLPDKTTADIDALDLAGLEAMYKDVGRRFLNSPERVQKLCDALR